MLTFELCPKCGGNILFEKDYYGCYKQCLQCGYLRDVDITLETLEDKAGSPVAGGDKRCKTAGEKNDKELCGASPAELSIY